MKKLLVLFLLVPSVAVAESWRGGEYDYDSVKNDGGLFLDTEDPLYMGRQGDFLFKTYARMSTKGVFDIGEDVQIGVNDRLALTLDLKYRQNFNGNDDGFAGPGIGAIFRTGTGTVISDLYGGVRLAGAQRVPEFANNTWFAGTRVGRQWSWVTLAAALESNWVFDDAMGKAYFDFIPDAYFRIADGFTAGLGATLRKSTTPSFDREWVNFKIGKQYGHTMYTIFSDYEFEMDEWRFGFRLNLLF